jgi:hypothetical protein
MRREAEQGKSVILQRILKKKKGGTEVPPCTITI